MRVQVRLNLRRLVLAVIALLSFGAILLKQSDQYLRVSAAPQTIVSVNAASYLAGPLARGSLVSAFGNNLSSTTEKAQSSTPAPTKLAGVTVQLTDSANVTHDAPLVYVDSKQINYVIPDETALGEAKIVVKNGSQEIATGKLEVVDASPALFSSNSGDRKLAVGMTGADTPNSASLVNPDGSARAIRPGSPFSPSTVTLLGTGLRFTTNLQVMIDGKPVDPLFVGPQPDAPGVDRVVLNVPVTTRSGLNTISLVANTKSSATTQSSIQTLSSAATEAPGQVQSSATPLASNAVQIQVSGDAPPGPFTLSAAEVGQILAQAVAKAQQINLPITAAVLDTEGNILGIFKMNGARSDVLLGSTNLLTGQPFRPLPPSGVDPDGLEQVRLPLAAGLGILSDGAALAAISKAGTAAFFSTQGSAISTRTASFIIQENFPPTITSQPGGPLFGVQFSQLPCSDVRNPNDRMLGNLPLGLAGDPGGLPIYKNGVAVGGLGIEGDGFYSIDTNIQDKLSERSAEEDIASAGIKGFRVAKAFQIDNVLIDGMRLEYLNTPPNAQDGPPAPSFDSLVGSAGTLLAPLRGQQFSGFSPLTLGNVPGRVARGFFPFQSSQVSSLTSDDVNRILTQAAQQAYRMRAAIRLPVAQPTEVNITVVDTSGKVLGLFSTQDAPQFGFDVCVQKARTALFFSLPNTESQLRAANANSLGLNIGKYADAAKAFGVPLGGQNAFTSRAMGFLARPFFPDGIPGTPNGPFSKPLNIWSPFNDGLQIALVKPALVSILTNTPLPAGTIGCSPLQNDLTLANGLQIFAGSAALYKNGVLVGAVGVSGDGIDQDDAVAGAGALGFDAPAAVRADQLLPLGVRLPYIKLPRHLNIGNPPAVPPIIRTSRVFANMN